MSQWEPYLIAIVVGLIVGIEREKSASGQKTMGVRTFLMISLLGALAGGINNIWLSALIAAFSLALILISYFTQTSSKATNVDRGLTTEFAGGIVFCLGFVAHKSPALAAALGPMVAVILFSKKMLHRFTHKISSDELEAALFILLAWVVVLDFAPDRAVDPWGVLNPRKFGYLVLTLAVLEFLSYLLSKTFGEKRGAIVSGFLGGFVSSTAVLLSAARSAKKNPDNQMASLCTAIAAKLASLVELLFIVGLISQTLLFTLLIPVSLSFLIGLVVLLFLALKTKPASASLHLRSPLDWKGIFRFAVILTGILSAVLICENLLGEQATFALAFTTGLFELHGTSLAVATMHSHGQLAQNTAIMLTIIALAASFVSKVAISWFICPGIFSRRLTLTFLFMLAPIVLAIWL